jgi:hypothetical protein
MARAELNFLELLIAYIDDNNLRIHPRVEVGYQYVQEMEIAFDLIWQLAYDGAHSALMRNIFAHPKGDLIVELTQDWKGVLPSRKAISESLAKIYNLAPAQLAITVNVFEKLQSAIQSEALAAYRVASEKSMIRLEETALAQSSRSPETGVGVTSGD